MTTFRHHYSPQKRVTAPVGGKARTMQQFKDEADVNVIMSRYMATGVLPQDIDAGARQYLDATGYDFQTAQNLIAGAASLFEQLPSKIRNRVDNDPAKLLAFLHDPKNRAEAEEMGLINRAPNIPATPLQTAAAAAAGAGTAPPPADPAGNPSPPAAKA